MKCQNCNAEIMNGAKFCQSCGCKVAPESSYSPGKNFSNSAQSNTPHPHNPYNYQQSEPTKSNNNDIDTITDLTDAIYGEDNKDISKGLEVMANALDQMFDKDTASIVRKHAFTGAILMMLPVPFIDSIGFIITLWRMYSALCKRANTTLKFKEICLGFIVNVLIAWCLDLVLEPILFLGWIGIAIIVYLQFYFSGKAYIETLKKIYQN